MTFRFFARAEPKTSTATLHLYDAIGPRWEGISAKDVQTALSGMASAKTLNVYINSPGGDVFEGIAIYNQLDRFAGDVNVFVDGIAASIASVIAMAGDTITMAANTQMMIHDPWTIAMGSAVDMRKAADMLDATRQTLIDTYAKRTKADPKEIASLMAAETWMTANDALARGFTDSVTNTEAISAENMGAFTLLSSFAKTPPALKKKASALDVRISELKTYNLRRAGASPEALRKGQPKRRETFDIKD